MEHKLMKHLSTVWTHSTDYLIERGEGVYLYEAGGKRLLDFTSGIGVTSTGHCHPEVVAAIREQAGRLIFGQINVVLHETVFRLIEELRTVVPGPLDGFFFANSGAEAVEAAVKLSKQTTGRSNVIVFWGSFHGRTHLTMSMTTSKTVYRTHYQPLVPGIFVAPYPYAYYYGWDGEKTLAFALRELEKLLRSQTAPDETACIVVEPVLGEGGYVVPPAGFMKALRALCDEHGILLVADEVQSGFGRTGAPFAFMHDGIVPDIMIMAKGMGSGVPISGLAYRSKLAEGWIAGTHGGTYGANTLACAAAAATVRVMREEKLAENAAARGRELLAGLRALQADYPVMGDVRGLGLMAACEFGPSGSPDKDNAKAVVKAAAAEGLLLLNCGTFDNVIRWIPPLVVTREQIAEGLELFRKALKKVLG
jgi:4-aminobutyrate aminotransferase